MTDKMFFEETKPGVFERNKKIGSKKKKRVNKQYNKIDNFCFKIRDGITNLFEQFPLEVKQTFLIMIFFSFKKLSYWITNLKSYMTLIKIWGQLWQIKWMLLQNAKDNCMTLKCTLNCPWKKWKFDC